MRDISKLACDLKRLNHQSLVEMQSFAMKGKDTGTIHQQTLRLTEEQIGKITYGASNGNTPTGVVKLRSSDVCVPR